MKKGILISALGLAAIVLSGCQNTQTGVGGSSPTNSNITQSQRSTVKTSITVHLNGGKLKSSGEETKTFKVRFSTMWQYIKEGVATPELPTINDIDYPGHNLLYYSLDRKGDDEIPNNYAFVEDTTIYAHYDVPSEDSEWVTWVNDDGKTVLNREKFIYGEHPYYHGETPVSTKEGHSAFVGWEPRTEDVVIEEGHGEYEFVARYINLEIEWKVTFHYNYEENENAEKITTQLVHDGDHATDPEPTRTGYDFFGWYQDPSFKGEKYDFKEEVHADLDLYAKWDDAKVTVVFDTNGGTIESGPSELTVKYGTTYGTIKNQLPTVSKKGYGAPDYWTLNSESLEIDDGYQFKVNTRIFAYYGEPTESFAITFKSNGGTWSDGETEDKTFSVLFGSVPDLGDLTLTINDHGTISSAVNWQDTGSSSAGLKPVSGDTTYEPIWKVTAFDITFNANGGKFSDGSTSKVVRTELNKTPSCETPTRGTEGTWIYSFKKWSPDCVPAKEPTTYNAEWNQVEDKVTINFNANGGSLDGSESLSVLRGTAWGDVANKPSATNAGYEFKGWGATADATEPIATSYTFENDYTTLYAIFAEKTFSITFNTDGGEWSDGDNNPITVEVKTNQVPSPGSTLTKREGGKIYTAKDWQESGSSDVGVKPATKDTTYNPVWSDSPSAYVITFEANGGKFSDDTTSREVITNAGQKPTCETPKRDSTTTGVIWVFDGWSPSIEPASSVKTYSAQWQESLDNVTVSFDSNGGTLTGDAIKVVRRGTEFGDFSDEFKANKVGYEFKGWGTSKDATNPISDSYEFNEDTTSLFAIYGTKQWTITFNNDGGTWDNGGAAPISKTVNSGEVADPGDTLTKHTNDGITYTSSGWKDSSGVSGVKPAVSNASYNPIWTAQAYDITFDAGEGYFDNNPATKQKVVVTPINQLPTCTNPTRAEDTANTYEFDGWNETIVLATGVATYTAKWKAIPIIQYWTITFNANGGSSVEPQQVKNEEKAMEPRTTWSKHEFKGWSTQEIDPNLEHLFNFAETPITSSFILYAQWEEIPDSYEITFNSKGGSTVSPQTVIKGNCVIEPAAPTKEGNNFKGWLTRDGDTTTSLYNFATPVEGSFTLYAWWEEAIPTFTVSFETQEGTPTPVPQTVQRGEKLIEPATPTKEGSVFQGWFTQSVGGEKFDFSTQITSSFTLYAQWKAETKYFEVSFDTQGGSTNPTTQTIEDGKTAIEPRAPTKEGNIFKGWSIYTSITSDDQLFDFTTPIKGKTDLYAIWDKEPEPTIYHTVTFDSNGGSYTPKAQKVEDGDTLVEPAAPSAPQEGYIFDCWSTSNSQSEYTPFDFSTPITADNIVLYAHYKLAPVVQTFKVQFLDKDTESPLIGEQTVVSGEKAIEPKDPIREEYVFRGWSTSKTEYKPFNFATTSIVSDTKLYAFWNEAAKYHQVTFDSCGGSEVPSQKIQDGNCAIAPKDPYLEGKIFAGWFKDQSYTQEFNFSDPIYDDVELFAKWDDMPTPTTYSNYWFGDLSVDTQDQYALLIGDDQTPHYSGEMGEFDKNISTFTITPVTSAELPEKEQIVVYVNQVKLSVDTDFTYVDGKITLTNPPLEAYSISIGVAPKESPGPIPPVPGETITVSLVANEVTSWVTHMEILDGESTVGRVESFKTFTIAVDDFDGLKVVANSHSHIPSIANIGLYIDGMPITITSAMYDEDTGTFNLAKCYEAFGGTPQYSIIVVVDGGK